MATATWEYIDEVYDDLPCDGSCEPLFGTPVTVSNNTDTLGIDFDLVRKGSISGVVISAATGNPIQAGVKLYDSLGQYLGYDSGLSYRFADLDAGTYYLTAGVDQVYGDYVTQLYDGYPCPGGAYTGCDPTAGTPVQVFLATETTDVNFQLVQSEIYFGVISGNISAVDEGGIGETTIRLFRPDGAEVSSVTIDGTDYSIDRLTPGDYFVVADSAIAMRDSVYDALPCTGPYPSGCDVASGTPVSVGSGATTGGIDFILERLGSISGNVWDTTSGWPVTYHNVSLYDDTGSFVKSATSASNGSYYRLSGLWPGTYYVATNESSPDYVDQLFEGLSCHGGPPQGCDVTTGLQIAVDFGVEVSGVDFFLDPAAGISGRVMAADTGEPIVGHRVEAWDADGLRLGQRPQMSSGAYEILGLDGGDHFVVTEDIDYPLPSSFIDELYLDIPCYGGPTVGCDPLKGDPVTVIGGFVTRFIDFALEPLIPETVTGIRGRVTDASNGSVLEGVIIDLWTSSPVEYLTVCSPARMEIMCSRSIRAPISCPQTTVSD